MENENYYLVIFKGEIIGIINEKELIELEKEDRIRNNKNIHIAKISKSNINDILKKNLIRALDKKRKKRTRREAIYNGDCSKYKRAIINKKRYGYCYS